MSYMFSLTRCRLKDCDCGCEVIRRSGFLILCDALTVNQGFAACVENGANGALPFDFRKERFVPLRPLPPASQANFWQVVELAFARPTSVNLEMARCG